MPGFVDGAGHRPVNGGMARMPIVIAAVVGLLLLSLPASAVDVTGNATWFTGLGSPYGGCGLPQADLDSQDFVALNVFDTPGDYGAFPRPVPPSMAGILGQFDNGLNCGRYVQVTIGDNCTGINDGAQNEPFCRDGAFAPDADNGATLTMVVGDSCADSNAWCRDDPFHLDLHQDSLNRFQLNGAPVGDLFPAHWNNRHVSWQFVPAPDYTGDIKIGFLQGAQTWWGATAISHLPNGIHAVQYFAAGAWHDATMDGDMGEAYVLAPTVAGGTQFQLRVVSADDTLLNAGRVYTFSLPASCAGQCSAAYTQVGYTTSDGTATPPPTEPPPSTGTCAATESITNSWPGGFQADVTVTDTGTTPLSGWTVTGAFPGGQTLADSWNAVVTQSGRQVSALNAAFDGSVPGGGSTTWGMTVNGAAQALSGLGCHP
jgi:hypothetical protein